MTLGRKAVAWVFRKGLPFNASASLEVLATLLCVMLVTKIEEAVNKDEVELELIGLIDYLSNEVLGGRRLTMRTRRS